MTLQSRLPTETRVVGFLTCVFVCAVSVSGDETSATRIAPATSLGDHIRIFASREQANAQSMQLVSNEDADGGSDVAEEKPSEEELRQATVRLHLQQLRKPIQHVELKRDNDHKRPENQAAGFIAESSPEVVTALGFHLPTPDRYTIAQYHRPLYFEQPNLERCGNGYGILQNGVSGLTFVGNTLALPFRAYHQPPDCLVHAGDDCMTCQTYQLPYKWFRPKR